MSSIIGSFCLYLICCAYFYLGGRALVWLLLRPSPGDTSYLLAPVANLAAHVIVIGIAVTYGFTTRSFAAVTWPIGLLLMLIGARNVMADNNWQWLRDALTFASLGAVPLCGAFYFGLLDFPGSPTLDGWSYIAFSQYLYDYRIGSEGGLAPLYQYASHLAGTRFIGPALIGYLAFPLIEFNLARDVQQAANLFLLIIAFSYASACIYVWRTHSQDARGAVVYGLLCISSYWIIRILIANNFDNFLFLAILPAIVSARHLGHQTGIRLPIFLGLLIAAEFYAYPEFAPVAVFLAFVCVATALIYDPEHRRQILRGSIAAIVMLAVVCAPLVERLWAFFVSQLAFGLGTGGRPGEGMFPELLVLREFAITFFGFRPPSRSTIWYLILLLSVGVAILFLRGILLTTKRKNGTHLLAFLFVMVGAYVYMLWQKRYDYGAYKFAIGFWWVTAYFILTGILNFSIEDFGGKAFLKFKFAFTALLLLIFSGTTVTYYWYLGPLDFRSLREFREAREHLEIVSNQAIYNALEDERANIWITYFLRDQPLVILNLAGYMAQKHVIPVMERSLPSMRTPGAGDIILVDSKYQSCMSQIPIWRNSKVAAIELQAEWPVLLSISSPNGLESQLNKVFTWIGNQPAVLRIATIRAANVVVSADLLRGPSAIIGQIPKLRISSGDSQRTLEVNTDRLYEISIPTMPGINEIRVWSDDSPDRTSHAMRDPRTMLIGFRCVSLYSGGSIPSR